MGKKKNDQNSGVITDPAMDPFFITMDEYNFTLMKRYNGDKGHAATVGYFNSFSACVRAIASYQSRAGQFDSLNEYVTNYQSIVDKLNVVQN
jgi:hypothetical protein